MERLSRTTFPDAIRAVKFNSKRVLVMTEAIIYIYDSTTMAALHTIMTVPNIEGIVALSNDSISSILLYPCSHVEGMLCVYDCLNLHLIEIFRAHHHRLAIVSLSPGGNLAATASVRGTIIRVFSMPDMQKLFTFKRGSSTAIIYDISFVPNMPIILTTSSSGTVHCFLLDQ